MSAADYKAQVKILADVLDSCPLTEPCDLMWRPTGWCKEHCKDGQDSPDAECWLEYARVMTENKTESDHIADSDKMVAIKLKKRTITERLIIAKSLIDGVIADSDNDHFREATKKIPDGPDTNVGSIRFKPGDKFILELGEERRMFGEFEIKGTDLYVKTDLLEKLTRYEPIANDGFVSKQAITDYLESLLDGRFKDTVGSGYIGLICEIRDGINAIQSEKIPYKKPEVIYCKDCTHHHYDKQDINYCDRKDYGYGWRDEDFCSRAERRSDG